MKKYRVADLNNGAFGDTYATYEEAMIARQECVEDGFKANLDGMDDEEAAMEAAQDFFRIVDAATGEEVAS